MDFRKVEPVKPEPEDIRLMMVNLNVMHMDEQLWLRMLPIVLRPNPKVKNTMLLRHRDTIRNFITCFGHKEFNKVMKAHANRINEAKEAAA